MTAIEARILTPDQEQLLLDLYDTKTVDKKVNRRRTNSDGSYTLYNHTRPSGAIDFAETDEEFAMKIHETFIGEPVSPFYLNLRGLPDEIVYRMAQEMVNSLPVGLNFDRLAGIPEAATPFVKPMSKILGVPFIDILDKANTSSGRLIIPKAGVRGHGETVILIDDLITYSDSKLEADAAAEEIGFKVVGFSVFADRQQGGAEQLALANRDLFPAFKFVDDMLPVYTKFARINAEMDAKVREYIEQTKIVLEGPHIRVNGKFIPVEILSSRSMRALAHSANPPHIFADSEVDLHAAFPKGYRIPDNSRVGGIEFL